MSDIECTHGAEVAVDWETGEILHEGDADWHPWDESVFGERPLKA